MRLNKISELIHGSSQHSNITYARVSVFFAEIIDNDPTGDDYEVVDGSQFVVSRYVYRDNKSKYYINQQEARFNEEVCPLLKSKGIDLEHNRFLILQGEVE